jgi:hypothetical protein
MIARTHKILIVSKDDYDKKNVYFLIEERMEFMSCLSSSTPLHGSLFLLIISGIVNNVKSLGTTLSNSSQRTGIETVALVVGLTE